VFPAGKRGRSVLPCGEKSEEAWPVGATPPVLYVDGCFYGFCTSMVSFRGLLLGW